MKIPSSLIPPIGESLFALANYPPSNKILTNSLSGEAELRNKLDNTYNPAKGRSSGETANFQPVTDEHKASSGQKVAVLPHEGDLRRGDNQRGDENNTMGDKNSSDDDDTTDSDTDGEDDSRAGDEDNKAGDENDPTHADNRNANGPDHDHDEKSLANEGDDVASCSIAIDTDPSTSVAALVCSETNAPQGEVLSIELDSRNEPSPPPPTTEGVLSNLPFDENTSPSYLSQVHTQKELKSFCAQLSIQSHGKKIELANRLVDFLKENSQIA